MKLKLNCYYLYYLEEYPDTSYVEMDTVIGRIGGKALLTFSFPQSSFMIANYEIQITLSL